MNILAETKEFCNISRPPFVCDNIPQEMKSYPQWCWAKITENKIPRIIGTDTNAKANGTNCENTWRKFEVYENIVKNEPSKAESYFAGFVLSNKDPYVIIDLDDKDTTTDTERATFRDIISYFCSYTEISSGGKGYHIILKCYDLPEKFAHNRKGHYEVYKDGRFMILTGNIYNNFKNIAVVKYEQICEFISKYCVNNEKQSIFTQKSIAENKTKPKNTPQNIKNNISLTDKQILDIAIKNTLNTANACLFGNSPYSNITDKSSADFALFCALIEAGASSQQQVFDIFHSLPIGSREKSLRKDYIERTYKNALIQVTNKSNDVYSDIPQYHNQSKNKPQIEFPELEILDLVKEGCDFYEPLPRDVLPQFVQDCINSLEADTPPELVALSVMPAFATVYQGHYDLKSYKGKKLAKLPVNLSSFILAPTSLGKSSTVKLLMKAAVDFSNRVETIRTPLVAQMKNVKADLKYEMERSIPDKKKIAQLQENLSILKQQIPVQNVLTIDGTSTNEAMKQVIEEYKNLLFFHPEAGNLIAWGSNKDAVKYLTEYTNRHDGIAPAHRTKTQGCNKSTNVRASQIYMLQPSTFHELGSEFLKLMISQGTLARTLFTCIYSYEKTPLDDKEIPVETTEEEYLFKLFYSVITHFLEEYDLDIDEESSNLIITDYLTLDDACYSFYVEKYNEINKNNSSKTSQENAIYGKVLENAQRLAVCFHFMDLIFNDINPQTLTPNGDLAYYAKQPISLDCFKRAYRFTEYCAKSQVHYANIGKGYEQINESNLLAIRCIQTLFTRKIFKNNMQTTSAFLANSTKSRNFKCKKADVDAIIPLLQKIGVFLVNDDSSVKTKGYVLTINPRLFNEFKNFDDYRKKLIKYK